MKLYGFHETDGTGDHVKELSQAEKDKLSHF
jgi:hypothetical protein